MILTQGVGQDGQFFAVRGSSSFEAVQLLSKEFSLRNRAEAAYFRSQLMENTFSVPHGRVIDTIRSMDVEMSKFRRLIEILPAAASRDGLGLESADLTLMLLRSMPEEVRNYVFLRAAGDDYCQ